MQVEDLLIPKDMCLLDFLTSLGERIENAWIFVHDNVVDDLIERNCHDPVKGTDCYIITCESTQQAIVFYAKIKLTCWYSLITIVSDDIAFKSICDEPDCIIRLKVAT